MLSIFVLLAATLAHGAETNAPAPAKLKISGYGFPGNRRLAQSVKLLETSNTRPEFFDADFIEDTRLILISRLHADGYPNPRISADVVLQDGSTNHYAWKETSTEPVPRNIRARTVHFFLQPGVRFYYRQIIVTDLSALSQEEAQSYFMETGALFHLKGNRVYTPELLERSRLNLQIALSQLGYRDARVTVASLNRDDQMGAVSAEIEVRQGHKYMVRSVREEVYFDDAATAAEIRTNQLDVIFSHRWEQDYALMLKTNYYHQGYPETAVTLRVAHTDLTDEEGFLELQAEVHTGPPVRVGTVRFEGASRTRISTIQRRVSLKPGQTLDRMQAERERFRLSRLGGFDRVELDYHPVNTNVWDVTYRLKEGRRMDLNLLFGIGSYDLLRGGVELNQYNLWGLAHRSRLQLVQSFKSSSGDYVYTIPEPFGDNVDFFVKASALRREEISFVRLEYGAGAGVQTQLPRIGANATVRYNYGILEATETSLDVESVGAEKPLVGEFVFDISLDRRDNPLNPQRGFRLSANLEWASPWLGGQVGFQRAELGASYHLPLGAGRWLHAGLRHGVAATIDRPDDDLPITRRFFPGGENSVRGYKEGEAAPRDADGNIVGAETYLSGSLELEQSLTPKWSLVGFVDAVDFAEHLQDYPGDQQLYSIGLGIRWKTIIGPLRVEYGHNLNPRPKDPQGTWQFSLGTPF